VTFSYDHSNIFAKILKKELPAECVYENEYALAFHDINPQAPLHVLVIPKGAYVNMMDFIQKAPPKAQEGFWKSVSHISHMLDPHQKGLRLISNNGQEAGQEVSHMHLHILGGMALGPLLAQSFNIKQNAE